MVWLRRAAFRMRGDLRVENDRGEVEGGVVGEPRDEHRLDLVTDQRDAQPLEQAAQGVGRLGTVCGEGTAIAADDRKRQRRTATRPRVVLDQRDADRGLADEPRLELGDTGEVDDLDASGSTISGCERGRDVVGRLERRGALLDVGEAPSADGVDGVEVEAELELRAGRSVTPARPPALGRPATRAAGT